jgi:hypothetical protein
VAVVVVVGVVAWMLLIEVEVKVVHLQWERRERKKV